MSERNEICTAHSHFILFVNLFLIILAIIGCCLDRRQKLVFEPMHAKGAAEANSKGKHVPVADSSIRSSIGNSASKPINVGPETELPQV